MSLAGLRQRLLDSSHLQQLALGALLRMDPETAHRATLNLLRQGFGPAGAVPRSPALATRLCGLQLSNPVGMAAGFDKNGEVPHALAIAGFGLIEVGTVTPRPQSGNPRPRLFRLPASGGVINRMGFNNDGHDALLRRLDGLDLGAAVLGINIGANKTSEDFVADYVLGVQRFAGKAGYLTVNVSSPNTPGLRDLQAGAALRRLLGAVLEARAATSAPHCPIFLKLAPDLDEPALDEIAAVVLASGVDGLIVSNTTLSRDMVKGQPFADEAGGLSGRPLFNLSTRRLAQLRQRVGGLPIIGAGGIHSPASAIAKFEAGANAIQLYSALVYAGMPLLDDIKRGLANAVAQRRLANVAELTGRATADWAAGKASL